MALLFDGSNDYLYTSRPFTDVDNWTLAAWVNYPGLARTFKMDVYNGEDGNPGAYNGYGFGLGGDNGGSGSKLVGLFGGVAWKNTTYTFSSADTWYHVVMVRTSGALKFYVNGSDVGYSNTDGPQTVGNTTGVFSVGAQDRNGEGSGPDGMGWYANTRIAEVAAWQRALSTGEIAALGKGFAPSFFKSSLLRYLPLINSTHKIEVARGAAITTGDAPTTYAHPPIYYPSSYNYIYTTTAAPSTSVKDMIGMGMIPFAR